MKTLLVLVFISIISVLNASNTLNSNKILEETVNALLDDYKILKIKYEELQKEVQQLKNNKVKKVNSNTEIKKVIHEKKYSIDKLILDFNNDKLGKEVGNKK